MVQEMSFGTNPYMYTSYPSPAQLGAYAGSRIPEMVSENDEDTLLNAITGGTFGCAAFSSIPFAIHPKETCEAIKKTNETLKAIISNPGFEKLSATDKLALFRNTLQKERFVIRIGNVSTKLRTAEESQKIIQALNQAHKNYQNAILSGSQSTAAKYSAEMNEIIAKGKKQGWFTRLMSKSNTPKAYSADFVTNAAQTAGNAAQKAENVATTVKNAGNVATSTKITNSLKGAFKTHGFKSMAVITGLIETFTEIIPAFKLGTSTGIKQLGKSAATIAADSAGFCVGSAAAGAVGVKVGAAIGTAICPVLGTAIGALIGLAGGMAGAWAGRKLAKSIVGKSEKEIAEAKQKSTQPQTQENQATQTNYSPSFAGATTPFSSNPFAPNMGVPTLTGIFDMPTDSLDYYV